MSTEACERYSVALRRLHALLMEGKGESDEYEAVTDTMDEPWRCMTATERACCRQLSVDLWKEHDRVTAEKATAAPTEVER